jgi:hypothetical protein
VDRDGLAEALKDRVAEEVRRRVEIEERGARGVLLVVDEDETVCVSLAKDRPDVEPRCLSAVASRDRVRSSSTKVGPGPDGLPAGLLF